MAHEVAVKGRPSLHAEAWAVAAAYAALTLVLTWPLAAGLSRDVPEDVADPLLNTWIVGWGADHVVRFASGEWSAFAGYWDANIFHPAALTLTYSEHLFAQALQAAPLYAATHDLILCYNLLFLSSFAIGGVGLFLLLRDMTGDSSAAFAGGAVFAFAPYRFEHAAHLQLLSLQWIPFVFLGLRRFMRSGRPLPLILAGFALVAHDLSCGYYLLFFSPFVAGYALFEMAAAGRLTSRRHWVGLTLCAGFALAVTLPFLLPYAEARQQQDTLRSALTVREFSADLAAWITATPHSRVWGGVLTGLDRPEGHLFPGLLPPLLALVATAGGALGYWRGHRPLRSRFSRWAAFLASLVVGGVAAERLPWPTVSRPLWHGPGFVVTPVGLVLFTSGTVVALLAFSADVRRLAARAAVSPVGFCAGAAGLAVWLSLGPEPRLWGVETGLPGLYSWLYEYVPGFDGLRAPARYAAVVVLFLSLLAGFGVARLRRFRAGALAPALIVTAAVLECVCVPLPLDRTWGGAGLRAPPPPGRVPEPAVYAAVRALPKDAVLVELPLGEIPWETRAMYYSTRHWRRLVNGYSGYFPRSYVDVRAALRDAARDPDAAWKALGDSGATHVIVHQWAWYRGAVGQRLASALEARGARRLGQWDEDVLLALPPAAGRGVPASLSGGRASLDQRPDGRASPPSSRQRAPWTARGSPVRAKAFKARLAGDAGRFRSRSRS